MYHVAAYTLGYLKARKRWSTPFILPQKPTQSLNAATAAARSAQRLLDDPPPGHILEITPSTKVVDTSAGHIACVSEDLDVLLKYTEDDGREEAGFEVCLFAELFHEMLQVGPPQEMQLILCRVLLDLVVVVMA